MLKRMLIVTLLASGAATTPLVACGGSQKDVEVKGKETETAKLAGEWEGSYEGKESGRTGTVKFSLQLGMHTAEGEVFMGGETPLKVQFIEVEGGQIQGTIAPYTDPNCDCQVETSFLGIISGDSISGQFSTKIGATGQIQTGSWEVARKP
jgi:hypothetical protein